MDAFARPLLRPELASPPGLKAWNGSDPATRYNVYRNNVVVSLVDALADTFPVVQQLVGEAFFRAMARAHACQTPPRTPILAHYGADFPGFIAAFEPASSLPYLADVARLEYAYVQAFHARDAPGLAPQALAQSLAQVDALPRLRCRFAPAVRLLQSRHPVVSIWSAHQSGGDFAAVAPGQAESALLVRPQQQVEIVPLEPGAAQCLSLLMAGQPLGAVFEQLGDNGLELSALFAMLLRTGALVALDLVPEGESP
ncbi:MAG: HvfC/BufC N-terminal domain-containing protein [Rhodoferax sp.]